MDQNPPKTIKLTTETFQLNTAVYLNIYISTNIFCFNRMKNLYVCGECDESCLSLEKAQRHYSSVHIPTAGLPLICSLPGCKWWGRTTNDFTKHTRSDNHKGKAAKVPNVTAMAIPNPKAMAIPAEAIEVRPRQEPTIETPKELIRPMEVRPLNTDVQQAVKRLKTTHENHHHLSNINTLSDPIVLDSYEPASPLPGPSYRPTPIHKPVPMMTSQISEYQPTPSTSSVVTSQSPTTQMTQIPQCQPTPSSSSLVTHKVVTPKISVSAFNTSTPLLDEAPHADILAADLDITPSDPGNEGDGYQFRRTRGEITGHFRTLGKKMTEQHDASTKQQDQFSKKLLKEIEEVKRLQILSASIQTQSLPSQRLRLADNIDNFYAILVPTHDPKLHQSPTSYSPTCPKCREIEQHLIAAVQTSAPELLNVTIRKDAKDLPFW